MVTSCDVSGMAESYCKRRGDAFGNKVGLAAPLKRPKQARAKFTVEAIYGALVRIVTRDSWAAVSMRALAEESGYAVGTIYDYFPDREAALSGYVRHVLEARLALIAEVGDTPWRKRAEQLVRVTYGTGSEALPLLPELIDVEYRIADRVRHERVFAELVDAWSQSLGSAPDLNDIPSAVIEQLVLMVWGTWRYAALVHAEALDDDALLALSSSIAVDILAPYATNGQA